MKHIGFGTVKPVFKRVVNDRGDRILKILDKERDFFRKS